MAARRTRIDIELSDDQGVFMISVAARLADMHPQTLRMYEARGLIAPRRSPKGTRLYSRADLERLRRIQEMTAELGMNLAGVTRVFALQDELARMSRRIAALERAADAMRAQLAQQGALMQAEIERVRRSFRAELVRYEPPGTALVPVPRSAGGVRIPVRRGVGG